MWKLRKLALIAAIAVSPMFGLAACNQTGGGIANVATAPAPVQELQQSAFAARSAYAVALRAANEYAALPRCGGTAQLCSKQSVVNLLRGYDTAADNATKEAVEYARSTSPNQTLLGLAVTGAQKAVEIFNSIASTVKGGA
jgi:hypothetical protein